MRYAPILFVLAGGVSGCVGGHAIGGGDDGGSNQPVGKGMTCVPCVVNADCAGGACAQYAGDDFCAARCKSDGDCAQGERCALIAANDGSEVQGCVPRSGACGASGCHDCPAGTTCDSVSGLCVAGTPSDGGSVAEPADASVQMPNGCAPYVAPDQPSCCSSCTPNSGNCQANGCYGGWWCDSSQCRCHAPPTNCGGGNNGGTPDMGGPPPPPPQGMIGPNGGSVSKLFFAVIGDTRPPNIDDTGGYPTAVITKIYADVSAMNPQPQFVVTTGDYMFASAYGNQGSAQMSLYMQAAGQFKNPIFAAMGNHECTGATASNCAGAPTNNMNAYMNAMVKPLGKQVPYYTVPINDSNGQWSAKIVIAACNDWDQTQYQWLQGELAKPTTYTFVVRHEPTGTSGAPCVSEMDALLSQSTYDLFIVGHSHTFNHSQKEVVIGNGGAPLSGNVGYGYATVEQQQGGFLVTQYDYMSAQPLGTFTVQ